MATTISTVNQALVDSKVVAALRSVLPMLNAFSLRVAFDGPKVVNDVAYVPFSTDPTGGTKTAGTIKSSSGTLAGTAVTLDTLYGAGWDAKEGQISAALFPSFWADKAAGGVYVCAKAVVDAALALVTLGNFGDTAADKVVCAAADFGQSDLADLWAKAEVKIKQRQRSFGMGPSIAGALFGESNLALTYANTGTNFVQTGVVPQLLGMSSWCYGAFPANSQNLLAAVFGKAAICAAVTNVDPLANAGEGNIVERRVITDPDSGISALYTMTADGGGLVAGEVAILFGVAKGQDAVVRVVSA
jgi:hypothetical protein